MKPVLILCVCVVSSIRPLNAQLVSPSNDVDTHVNVRSEPTTNSAKVGELHPGETAALLDSAPSWYRVRLTLGTEGFVSKRWTDVVLTTEARTPFAIHFLDVGTGDSAIIDVGEHEIVIDGGNTTGVLHDYARDHGLIDGPIELVVVTHGDQDHWRGLVRLLGFDTVGTHPRTMLEFWDPGYDRDCDAGSGGTTNYLAFIDRVSNIGAATIRRPLEDSLTPATVSGQLEPLTLASIPEVRLSLLHSDKEPEEGDCSYQINNASIVIMVEIDTFRFLFTGDANGKERHEIQPPPVTPGHVEKKLLDLDQDLPADILRAHVLKVPHHGSETASTQDFIDAVDPGVVIFSASPGFDLPRVTVVARYASRPRTILRTDRQEGNDNDHIVCFNDEEDALHCEYED